MTTAATPDDFTDVFAREQPEPSSDRDRGADTAAPVDGPARDEQGRFAPREPAPEPKPETQAQQPAPKEATPQPTTEADQARQPRHVPLPELLSEREKRQQEARLREEAERRARDLESRVAEYERQLQQQRLQQQAQQEQEQAPDPWNDPKGALEYRARQIEQRFQQQLLLERSNMSETRARERWGDQAVTAAEEAAIRAGYASHFLNQRDPYAALMKWHKSTSFMAKVGDDPDAYEKSIEQRAYERALADLRAGKVPATGSAAAAPQRFPGSLADATSSSNGTGAVLTDEAIANELFDTNRNRRHA